MHERGEEATQARNVPGSEHYPKLAFSVLTSATEKSTARALVEQVHYQGSVPNGCEFVGCYRITDMGQALIGAAALGPMAYSRPTGRAALAEQFGVAGWQNLDRPALIRELGLVCGLRFVVAEDYQGLGIGQQLAKAVRTLAHSSLQKSYSRVEVMRRICPQSGKALIAGDLTDWLVRAGYKPTCLTKKNGHHLLYYWAYTLPPTGS